MSSNPVTSEEFSSFDPFAMSFRNDTPVFDADLLAESPGFIMMEGIPSAYVASYAHNLEVLRDPDKFSSVKPKGLPGMERVDFFNSQPVMNYSDDPQHNRLRRVVNPTFSPRRVKDLSEVAASIIDETLSEISENQHIDAVAAIAKKVAYGLLLNHFMGVEKKDEHIFFEYGASLFLLDQVRPGESKPKAFLDAWAKGREYCRRAVARAKAEKSDNLIGIISRAAEGGEISDDEMMAMMVVLFTGGAPTLTANSASSLYHLARNPDIAERIRQEPALAKRHMEESLRIDPPVTMVMRFATEDVKVGDKLIRRGMPVYSMISVGGRDPAEFRDPQRFDIDRPSLRHMSFGNGIHTCIGNSIVRVTVPLLIAEVAKRFPNLRLDPAKDISWETSPRSRHMVSVPLIT